MILLMMYSAVMVFLVIGFLWFLGRAKKLKDANDVILETELFKKMNQYENSDNN